MQFGGDDEGLYFEWQVRYSWLNGCSGWRYPMYYVDYTRRLDVSAPCQHAACHARL